MAAEWYYDNDYNDECEDEYSEPDEDDEWACAFGEHCLMLNFIHQRSECHTAEMAQAWQEEAMSETEG